MHDVTRWAFLLLFVCFMVAVLYFALHLALPLSYIIGVSVIGVITVFSMASVKKGELHD